MWKILHDCKGKVCKSILRNVKTYVEPPSWKFKDECFLIARILTVTKVFSPPTCRKLHMLALTAKIIKGHTELGDTFDTGAIIKYVDRSDIIPVLKF
jgi:hypothetical protein